MRGGIDMQSGGEAFLPQFQTAGNSQISHDFHSCVSALAVGGGLNGLHSQSCQPVKGHFVFGFDHFHSNTSTTAL